MAEPTVTAAIPVYNGEAYLAEAIESVLGQESPCEQVIVVDNGSTDASVALAQAFARALPVPLFVFREPAPGKTPAIEHSRRLGRLHRTEIQG